MRHSTKRVWLRLVCVLLIAAPLTAQSRRAKRAVVPATIPATVPALLLSDIHFDPLRDPAKAPRLNEAPVSQWGAILASPATPTADADYAVINKTCPIKPLVDPNNQLFQSALVAIHQQAFAPGSPIRFAVVTGDIVGHQFDCRYKLLFPSASHAEYRSFVEKTATYVISSLTAALPGLPVYMTLGNDDTACRDNSLTPGNDEFLAAAAPLIARTLPAADRAAALRTFPHGYYASTLPSPIARTRIFVLDDVYEMATYKNCEGRLAPTAQNAQLSWLAAQLDQARAHHQQAWVVAHVPPGVNPYSTFNSQIYKLHIDVCHGGTPISFLASDELAQLLATNADVVRLALFGHSHTDEMRLLTPSLVGLPALTIATISGPAQPDEVNVGVAVKILPSISPVFAELPSFTLAAVDTRSGSLADYSVIMASNATGVDATWAKTYTFSETYHLPAFTPATIGPLIARMQADPTAQTPASQAYLREYRHYFYADDSVPLVPLWPQFACTMDHISATAFTQCACPTAK